MRDKKYGAFLLLTVALLLHLFPPGAEAVQKSGYELAVVPSFPPVTTYQQWTPLAERLAKETGIGFRLKLYETMGDFELDIVSPEAPDFIFANALQAVVAHQEQGYLPLVRGSGHVWVELFVAKDSPCQSVDDLSGKRIAFVGNKNL